MPASLRIEIFPSDFERCVDFYTKILHFEVRKLENPYVYLARDNIFIGAVAVPNNDSLERKQTYRQPTKGIEIVLEVDDLEEQRDWIVKHGYKLDADITLQEWGLRDFRMSDPDGYYLRFTTCSPSKDGKGLSVTA